MSTINSSKSNNSQLMGLFVACVGSGILGYKIGHDSSVKIQRFKVWNAGYAIGFKQGQKEEEKSFHVEKQKYERAILVLNEKLKAQAQNT